MDVTEQFIDMEVKLAYQERLIRELDALVREFGTRLDAQARELGQLKQSLLGEDPQGPPSEKPPHY